MKDKTDIMVMNAKTVDLIWEPLSHFDTHDCWDYSIEFACIKGPEDLHLATELGKSLLEHNKELVINLKDCQVVIDDQEQEIEFMKKQTAALREANDSRLDIYEQLEISMNDLEIENRRLVVENTNDKKLIKSHMLTIENLEMKCEDLEKKINDLISQNESLERQNSRLKKSNDERQFLANKEASISRSSSTRRIGARSRPRAKKTQSVDKKILELLRQLNESQSQRNRERKWITDQFAMLLQEKKELEDKLNGKLNSSSFIRTSNNVKNLYDEINTLDEVRHGNLCGRCLRGIDLIAYDEVSEPFDRRQEDDDTIISFENSSHRESETFQLTGQPERKLCKSITALFWNSLTTIWYELSFVTIVINPLKCLLSPSGNINWERQIIKECKTSMVLAWNLFNNIWKKPFTIITSPLIYLKKKSVIPTILLPL